MKRTRSSALARSECEASASPRHEFESVARRRRWAASALVLGGLAVLSSLPSAQADPPTANIESVAGRYGDGGPATSACLAEPWGLALDSSGNLYIADIAHHSVRMVSPTGVISGVAGTGDGVLGAGFDGAPPLATRLNTPCGVAFDPSGRLVVADSWNFRVRRIAFSSTSTIAGMGVFGFAGDGGQATNAQMSTPYAIAYSPGSSGRLYIADSQNHRVRRLDANNVISTFVGTGAPSSTGDGGAAASASVNFPMSLAFDADGDLYIAELDGHRIRKVTPSGSVSTVVGTGTAGFSGDGGSATAARLNGPRGVATDSSGNLYIADTGNHRVRRVDASGNITTFAGTGTFDESGDGGPATAATLKGPRGVLADASGNVYISDLVCVRKVAANGAISTVAGSGFAGVGDGGPSIGAGLSLPQKVAVDAAGNVFVADTENHRVRRLGAADGIVTTVAGTGTAGFSGDGGAATSAKLNRPQGVAVDAAGNVYITDTKNQRIRKIDTGGVIRTIAGNGSTSVGDGGDATSGGFNDPQGIAVDAAGNVFVADTFHARIRKVSAAGTITTVAGNGTHGFSGDGGAATSASLLRPGGVAVDGAGNLFIADVLNNRVRKVSSSTGVITTVAGVGPTGFYDGHLFGGDGGPAVAAHLVGPADVAVDMAGNLYVADSGSQRVRKIDAASGIVSTIAGNGSTGPDTNGDGIPATSASLFGPVGVAVSPSDLYIADTGHHRIRRLVLSGPKVTAPTSIVAECDDGEEGASILFAFDVTVGAADLLRVRDVTGSRTLLETENPTSGSYGVGPETFPHGASAVVIELLQGTTVLASATVSIQISDTVPPALSGVGPKTVELTGPLTPIGPELLGISASDACDPNPSLTIAPAALALGTTTVTATATDKTGLSVSETFDVTVTDTVAPMFTVFPRSIERPCESAMTVVSFDTQADDLSGTVTIACTDEDGRAVDPAGTPFSVAAHTVTCVASDGSGNQLSASFTVTIFDDDAPVVVCPGDLTVATDAGMAQAPVAFEVTATDECDPDVGVTCEAPWGPVESGDAFPVGRTTVLCTSRDHSGNVGSCSFAITVQDREAPVISGASSVTLSTDCMGRLVALTPTALGVTAADNVDGSPTITVSPSTAAPGTTSVTVTATDGDGNESRTTISVTVLKGALAVRFEKPLEMGVDNLIKAGQTVPLKVRALCGTELETSAVVTVWAITRLDTAGTPVGNLVANDSGASNDDGDQFRSAGGFFVYNLSTEGWPASSGVRFRVTVKVAGSGHEDAFAFVVLRNR